PYSKLDFPILFSPTMTACSPMVTLSSWKLRKFSICTWEIRICYCLHYFRDLLRGRLNRSMVGFRRPLHLRDTQKLADILIRTLSCLSVVNHARSLLAWSNNALLGPR